uniref:Uncharacterized protein n=1 Tax=Anguilla anguilla TaxID=7936 RepID=A0A0E9PGX7_ANGAN
MLSKALNQYRCRPCHYLPLTKTRFKHFSSSELVLLLAPSNSVCFLTTGLKNYREGTIIFILCKPNVVQCSGFSVVRMGIVKTFQGMFQGTLKHCIVQQGHCI